jgi:hypothetical protein
MCPYQLSYTHGKESKVLYSAKMEGKNNGVCEAVQKCLTTAPNIVQLLQTGIKVKAFP